jgi:hypothetical protein
MTPLELREAIRAELAVFLQKFENLFLRSRENTHYTIEGFGGLVSKKPFTIREWCRLGRINAERIDERAGPHARWRISHAEYLRYQKEGLLPPDSNRNR